MGVRVGALWAECSHLNHFPSHTQQLLDWAPWQPISEEVCYVQNTVTHTHTRDLTIVIVCCRGRAINDVLNNILEKWHTILNLIQETSFYGFDAQVLCGTLGALCACDKLLTRAVVSCVASVLEKLSVLLLVSQK